MGSSGGASEASGSSGGFGNRFPTIELTMETTAACDGATATELRATRYACVDPPPAPCTLSDPLRTDVGTRIECPSADEPGVWRVELELPGRYYVELVSIASDGSETGNCVSNRDNPTVIVDDPEFNTRPTIEAMVLDEPCPVP